MTKTRTSGLIFALLFLGYGIVAQDIQLDFWASEELFTARTFPTLIAFGGGILSLLLVISPQTTPIADKVSDLNLAPVITLLGLMVGYSLLLASLGFIVSSSLFLLLAFMVLGERRPLPLLLISVAVTIVLYLLLTALDIHLEPGILRFLS